MVKEMTLFHDEVGQDCSCDITHLWYLPFDMKTNTKQEKIHVTSLNKVSLVFCYWLQSIPQGHRSIFFFKASCQPYICEECCGCCNCKPFCFFLTESWSPELDGDTDASRADGAKLTYERDFLLQFQTNPLCMLKPEGLPDLEVVLGQARTPGKPGFQQARYNSLNHLFSSTF